MYNKILTMLILVLGVQGCDVDLPGEHVTEKEIWGTYKANYDAGLVETIELRPDSTYYYFFKAFDERVFAITDHYTFWYGRGDTNRPNIGLRNFSCPFPTDAPCYRPNSSSSMLDTSHFTYIISPYKYPNGTIVLNRCPSDKQYYVKQ